jgi:trehalose 6-phosphate synthase/phosphatase
MRCVPVTLTPSEIASYYDGFSNGVLWPLFHYQLDRIPTHARDWQAYRQVNERFAAAIAAQYRAGDVVWIHDYQLMLVPALLRQRIPNARIGFFLHIPFPATDVLRILPWREEIIGGLLGSDLVGFHTLTYKKHFASSIERLLGISVDGDVVRLARRSVRVGVFPMGIDAERWKALATSPGVEAEAAYLRRDAGDGRMLLGVDRLDYTKGMTQRLVAFERLLDRHAELRGRVRLVQLAVPSRDRVASYQEYRRELNEHVGRINGAHATLGWTPIHYVHRPFSEDHLAALYRAADVMLVTPLRDGMNLVAKEFVACRTEDDGVLVLSEFAGAAAEMTEALIVNPYDVDALAHAIHRALEMRDDERRFRMRALRERVATHDVHAWSQSFIDALAGVAAEENGQATALASDGAIDALVARVAASERVTLLLDYDGTLVPLAAAPDLAAPDDDLLDLLRSLGGARDVDVHVVSGRRRDSLERWLGELPLSLHAEHGFWSRAMPGKDVAATWTPLREADVHWKTGLRAVLERFTNATPGAIVEEKTASLAWHYRLVDAELAVQRVDEVRRAIESYIRGMPLEILRGHKVLEVRLQGVSKAVVAATIRESRPDAVATVAIGDDLTDEELFRALPADAATISVGRDATGGRYRLNDCAGVRVFLREMLAARS